MQQVLDAVHYRAEGFYSQHGNTHQFLEGEIDLAVCTIEKANSLINRLLEDPAKVRIFLSVSVFVCFLPVCWPTRLTAAPSFLHTLKCLKSHLHAATYTRADVVAM